MRLLLLAVLGCGMAVATAFVPLLPRQQRQQHRHAALLLLLHNKQANDLDVPHVLQVMIEPYLRSQRAKQALRRQPPTTTPISIFPQASSAHQAQAEYQLVQQTMEWMDIRVKQTSTSTSTWFTLMQEQGDDKDDDEWVDLTPNLMTPFHVVQAQQLIQRLIQIQTDFDDPLFPGLASLAHQIDPDGRLPRILDKIQDRVLIQRASKAVGASNKMAFTYSLNAEVYYPALARLKEKHGILLDQGKKEWSNDVAALQEEIDDMQEQIYSGLYNLLAKTAATPVDQALHVWARLDGLLGRAQYALEQDAILPTVGTDGMIHVPQFVHPLLPQASAVPIDLILEDARPLIVSGPNGNGKSLACKSFGLVASFVKMGMPIPVACGSTRQNNSVRVDYFEDIFVDMGDAQSVLNGASTWTSKLSFYASLLENLQQEQGKHYSLILLDELGSGTDPEAGGALAQALLEELQSIGNATRVVATTHAPRLKTISWNLPQKFACATVAVSPSTHLPAYRLEYGLIGESMALAAAQRQQNPPLPSSLLRRAEQLQSQTSYVISEPNAASSLSLSKDVEYKQALIESLQKQIESTRDLTRQLEEDGIRMRKVKEATVSLADAYATHLGLLLDRVQQCFQQLKDSEEKSDLEVLGETMEMLRVVKKQAITERQRLEQQGLQIVDDVSSLQVGESVVVVAAGPWKGASAVVTRAWNAGCTDFNRDQVMVQFTGWDGVLPPLEDEDASFHLRQWADLPLDKSMAFGANELAVWNYDVEWNAYTSENPIGSTSIQDSRQKLNTLLASLTTSNSQVKGPSKQGSFQSSRERKAAKKGKRKKK